MEPDFWLSEKVKVIASDLRYVKSVDGFLVKLSSLIYDISDECLGEEKCIRMYFEKALVHPLLRQQLERLACYTDVVEKLVLGDPRFKVLRNHLETLLSTLRELKCTEPGLEIAREATFRIERAEEKAEKVPVPQPQVAAKRLDLKRVIVLVVTIAAAVLLVVALLKLLA